MADVTQIPETDAGTELRPESAKQPLLNAIGDELPGDHDRLDLYEGATTGHLYATVDGSYYRGELTASGLSVDTTADPHETLEPLARINPDEGETVSDAVRSITFAGD